MVLHDREQSVFAWLRFGQWGEKPVLVVCNFTPVPRYQYEVGVSQAGAWREVLNSDAGRYGGSNLRNEDELQARAVERHDQPASLSLLLPPLSTLILTPV